MNYSAGRTFLDHVTPVILTFNEEANIGRTLDRLTWANQIVVVDSGSTDATQDIVKRFPRTKLVHRTFETHANQWNFAINDTGIQTPWVLAMDADYVLTSELVKEISELSPESAVGGYQTRFSYCVFGRPLRATLYPPVITLFLKDLAHYVQDGHTQRVVIEKQTIMLRSCVMHDDRKPIARWLWAQNRYAGLELNLLMARPASELRLQDRIRKLGWIAPWLVPLYCLTVGRGFLDGWPGIFYAMQRGVAESILSLRLLEAKLSGQKITHSERSELGGHVD